ncbi:MAG: hypothetical protein J6B30_09115 [Muribaculaceae bacterium]|nr:hypothetical protein [Muribaculaceae bacterium]MBR3831960.1 hypothetical protein [Muribaculaceae bacterium]
MKKWVVFLLGAVAGIVLTIAVLYLMSACSSANNGVTYFEKPGDCISTKSLEVFQVLDNGVALANEVDFKIPTGLIVLLINKDGKYYYDNQVIEIPEGKCARQVGVYTYPTKMEIERTVPIVEIME